MQWHKDKTEETEELRQFVEGMKRGQTLPTSDSLLETLRQIHDRRVAPVVGHDHKRMLLERLRRQARVRDGEPVDDSIRVPEFATVAPRRRFLELAVAASLVLHVGLGAFALTYELRFDRIFTSAEETARAHETEQVVTSWVLAPVANHIVEPNEHPSIMPASARETARGRAPEGVVGASGMNAVPAVSSAPVGPPVVPGGGAPIVSGYSPTSLEGQADRNLPDDAGPALSGPAPPDEPRPFTDVRSSKYDQTEEFDVAPRTLYSPKPVYTAKALEYQIKGTVRVSALVGSDGTVRDLEVIRSLGYGLDEAAIDAVRRMKFAPATRNGVPVTVRVKVDVEFGLR